MKNIKNYSNLTDRQAISYTISQWRFLKNIHKKILRNIDHSLRTEDEACKTEIQELYEHRQ